MSGALNTQAPEFPEEPSIYDNATPDAGDFRDMDLQETAVRHKADFSSVPNETMSRPHDTRSEAIAERRIYANGPGAFAAENVSEMGARRYSAFTSTLVVGTEGYAGAPYLLLGEDRSRIRAVLSNVNISESFVVGPLDQVSNGSGFLVPPNTVFETTVTEPVYACIPPAGAVNLAVGVWAEYA